MKRRLNETFKFNEAEDDDHAPTDANVGGDNDEKSGHADNSTRISKALDLMFKSPIVRDMNNHELIKLAITILDQADVDLQTQKKLEHLLGVAGKTAR